MHSNGPDGFKKVQIVTKQEPPLRQELETLYGDLMKIDYVDNALSALLSRVGGPNDQRVESESFRMLARETAKEYALVIRRFLLFVALAEDATDKPSAVKLTEPQLNKLRSLPENYEEAIRKYKEIYRSFKETIITSCLISVMHDRGYTTNSDPRVDAGEISDQEINELPAYLTQTAVKLRDNLITSLVSREKMSFLDIAELRWEDVIPIIDQHEPGDLPLVALSSGSHWRCSREARSDLIKWARSYRDLTNKRLIMNLDGPLIMGQAGDEIGLIKEGIKLTGIYKNANVFATAEEPKLVEALAKRDEIICRLIRNHKVPFSLVKTLIKDNIDLQKKKLRIPTFQHEIDLSKDPALLESFSRYITITRGTIWDWNRGHLFFTACAQKI
jgi:hypothetical protein